MRTLRKLSKTMPIHVFIGALPQGGAERVVSYLVNKLFQSGFNVDLVLLRNDIENFYKINDGIKIINIADITGSNSLLKNVRELRKLFKRERCLIVSFLAQYNIVSTFANMGLRNAIIVADRNDPRRWPSRKTVRAIRNFAYRMADGVILQTETNKSYFSKKVQKKSTIIFNPVDVGEYAGSGREASKEQVVINVARLMPQKNQKLLIEAFKDVLRKHPEYRLKIVGDGPEKDTLNELIEKLGLTEKVELLGARHDVFDLVKQSEIFVLSSEFEGMPNALIEAMCIGTACISTKVSGANELIRNEESGLLIDIGNKEQLTEAINKLIEDGGLRNECVKNGIATNELLNIDKIISEWITVINRYLV